MVSLKKIVMTLNEKLESHLSWLKAKGMAGAQMMIEDESLTNLDWSGFKVYESILINSHITYGIFNNTDFYASNLASSIFEYCSFNGTQLAKSTCDYSEFRFSNIQEVNFSGTSAVEATFSHCKINNCNFKNAYLTEAIFEYCNLDEIDFTGATLEKACFIHVNFSTIIGIDLASINSINIGTKSNPIYITKEEFVHIAASKKQTDSFDNL
jgi:uncharacterized protein YjbI with pentapeptide repeats